MSIPVQFHSTRAVAGGGGSSARRDTSQRRAPATPTASTRRFHCRQQERRGRRTSRCPKGKRSSRARSGHRFRPRPRRPARTCGRGGTSGLSIAAAGKPFCAGPTPAQRWPARRGPSSIVPTCSTRSSSTAGSWIRSMARCAQPTNPELKTFLESIPALQAHLKAAQDLLAKQPVRNTRRSRPCAASPVSRGHPLHPALKHFRSLSYGRVRLARGGGRVRTTNAVDNRGYLTTAASRRALWRRSQAYWTTCGPCHPEALRRNAQPNTCWRCSSYSQRLLSHSPSRSGSNRW